MIRTQLGDTMLSRTLTLVDFACVVTMLVGVGGILLGQFAWPIAALIVGASVSYATDIVRRWDGRRERARLAAEFRKAAKSGTFAVLPERGQ